METRFEIAPRVSLTAAQKREMFQLLEEHFDGVTPGGFARDLAEKNHVLLLKRNERLVGFSTQLAYTTSFEGEPVNVIYSGDTIVSTAAWGTTALPRAWVAGVEALRAALPPGRSYWLLLTSGFRTYRFLPVFWREFFPRWNAPMPALLRRLRDQLGAERFSDQYDPQSGIVRFRQPQRLRGRLKMIPDGRANNPHVAFFVEQNPGCDNGDELVCLAEMSEQNLTAAGRRIVSSLAHETVSHNC